jgi:PST family polysaccharide transporter
MSENSSDQYSEVAKKTMHGIGWNYLAFGFAKALNILTISILAHLLAPKHFGLVALATLTTDYLSVLSDLGLDSALVQRRQNVERSANIAFSLDVTAGVILTVVTYFIAPYAAVLFHEPEATSVIRWVGLTFILTAAGSANNALLQRELNFRKRIIPNLASTVVKAVISIGMAVAGFGVWSLVAGQLLGTATSSALLWIMTPWRPKLDWDTPIGKQLLRFGFPIMSNNALSVWEQNFDYFIIGILYNSSQLGVYTLAYRLPQTLVLSMLWLITSVLFPAFSSLQDQKAHLKKSFLSSLRYVQLFVTPLCLGMFVAADPLIRVLFGEQWVAAIPILRALSLYAWVISMGYHVGDVYKAIGRPDILIKMSIPLFIVRLALLWIGAHYSLLGVGIAHLIAASIELVVRYFVAAYLLQITLFDVIKELTALVCGAVLFIFALPAIYITSNSPAITQLIVVVIAGAVGYLGAIWMIERNSIFNALRVFGLRQSNT